MAAGGAKITSVIAHIDHGKTTLMDSLIAFSGNLSKALAGDMRYMDSRPDEQSRRITLKLGPVDLGNGHIFIDTPGHADFESLVICSAMLADNFLVIVDVNEGVTPRMYSLIKHINRERAVLVINKIDKCESLDSISAIICQMNSLTGGEVFSWEKNNVILACASLCAGISYGVYKFGKKNTLKTAFSTFLALGSRYDNNDITEILEKYKIKFKTRKNVFSTVLPLNKAIFDTVDSLPPLDYDSFNISEIFYSNFYKIEESAKLGLLGITAYGMFHEKGCYTSDNLLFVTKLIKGCIRNGDKVYTSSSQECRETKIEEIYVLAGDRFISAESASGPTLVFLKGNFLKNSVCSDVPVKLSMKNFMTPFYMAKLILKNLDDMPRAKEVIRAISYTEQCFKAVKTRYSEIEMRCSGRVQFEKICADLEAAKLEFSVNGMKKEFREQVGVPSRTSWRAEDCVFDLSIWKNGAADENVDLELFGNHGVFENDISERTNLEFSKIEVKNGNIFYIGAVSNSHIVESVLRLFIEAGPLIREPVANTTIKVSLIKATDFQIYNIFRSELTKLYLSSDPQPCPRLVVLQVSVQREYLGPLYTAIDKVFSIVDSEDFDEDTEFFHVKFKIPQFSLDNVLQAINIKTKGTAYIEVSEGGFAFGGDFTEFIKMIRDEKGMHTDAKIVENPEKQRTCRR